MTWEGKTFMIRPTCWLTPHYINTSLMHVGRHSLMGLSDHCTPLFSPCSNSGQHSKSASFRWQCKHAFGLTRLLFWSFHCFLACQLTCVGQIIKFSSEECAISQTKKKGERASTEWSRECFQPCAFAFQYLLIDFAPYWSIAEAAMGVHVTLHDAVYISGLQQQQQ